MNSSASLTAGRLTKTDTAPRARFSRATAELLMVIAFSVFGLLMSVYTAGSATGQEKSGWRAAIIIDANVLPALMIAPEALAPNLDWMPTTGDGGAVIEPKETAPDRR
ncbi:MAG TPA: hypothetical protein VKT73_05795 [Xanthobacteraceae bacterium]|nr:hypothetical protein [Xanthobacteraceae bacterium]